MRYLYLISFCILFSCQKVEKKENNSPTNFEGFDKQFPQKEKFVINPDLLFHFPLHSSLKNLNKNYYSYLLEDTLTVKKSKIDSTRWGTNVEIFAKTKIGHHFNNYITGVSKWTPEYIQTVVRGNLFIDSIHINTLNLGVLALSIYPEKKESYGVFFSIEDSVIHQQKVSVACKKNLNEEEPEYLFNILDTLETSKFIIQMDGTFAGKNLVEIKL